MLKILVLTVLVILCEVQQSKADFFGYYLDYFGLRDKYIPIINDDMDKIQEYKSEHD